jgi:hypothetical protein
VSAFDLISYAGIPLTVLLVAVVLTGFARPDRVPDGTYTAYLGFAQILSLYTLLLALTATAEAVAEHLVVGDGTPLTGSSPFSNLPVTTAQDGDLAPAIAAGAVAIVMVVVFVFHARRRAELRIEADPGVAGIDRAYRATVCFAMASLAIVAAMAGGNGAYRFIARPVGISDQARDLAGFAMVIYGALLVATFVIFRAHFWDIRPGRGNDEVDDGGVATVEGSDR